MSDDRPPGGSAGEGEGVDLAYIGRALQRLTADVASMRDEMKVQTAIILRHETMLIRLDETLNGILQQITAMVSQNSRIVDRVRMVEDRVDAIEEQARSK
jgi:hypothetical protein